MIIESMKNSFSMSGGSAGLSAIFLAGLLALWFFKYESRPEVNDLFWYALLSLIVIITPFYTWIVYRLFPKLTENNMFLWVLPVVPVTLYVAVVVLARLESKTKRVMFSLGLIGIMLLATTTSYEPNEIKLQTNNHYVDNSSLLILEGILKYADKIHKDEVVILAPDKIMTDARIYDARIHTLYARDYYEGVIDSEMHQIYEPEIDEIYGYMKAGFGEADHLAVKAEANAVDAIIIPVSTLKDYKGNGIDNSGVNDFEKGELIFPKIIGNKYKLIYSDNNYCIYGLIQGLNK